MVVLYNLDINEKVYWNHEIAERLGIGESTLRKWCIELEKNGYIFIRGTMDSRAFTVHDLTALNHFKELTKNEKKPKTEAAMLVVARFKRKEENEETPPVHMENEDSKVDKLEKMVERLLENSEKQEKFNQALIERMEQRLEQQERYIRESIDKRDRLLLESIRNTQEEAAAKEEERKQQEELEREQKKKLGERIKGWFGIK